MFMMWSDVGFSPINEDNNNKQAALEKNLPQYMSRLRPYSCYIKNLSIYSFTFNYVHPSAVAHYNKQQNC